MNKVELIKAVAEATNNTQKDIKVIMEAVQDVTYGALVEGDEVKLMDGVTLSVVHKDARIARNPRTGESVEVDATITAVYDSKIREYTVKYVSKGLSLQESTAQYGSYVKYTGDTPVYTAEESAYKYNLFKGWDKSGFVDGNKTINSLLELMVLLLLFLHLLL